MKYAIYDTASGNVLRVGEHYGEGAPLVRADETLYEGEAALGDRIVSGAVIVGGKVDYTEKRKQLKYEIEQERSRRINDVIVYDTRNLDADRDAQKNIEKKLKELDAIEAGYGSTYPELFMWRDADNGMRTFADIAELRGWLLGLVAAIAQRGTVAYAWSWQRKADLDATADADLAAFDPVA